MEMTLDFVRFESNFEKLMLGFGIWGKLSEAHHWSFGGSPEEGKKVATALDGGGAVDGGEVKSGGGG